MTAVNATLILEIEEVKSKLIVFDRQYKRLLQEEYATPMDMCKSEQFIFSSIARILEDNRFRIRAINFTGDGASLIFLDDENRILKYHRNCCSVHKYTSSPLFQAKAESQSFFDRVKYIMHLPQYMSYLVSNKAFSELTSIGSHSCLWDFEADRFLLQIEKENISPKLPPLVDTRFVTRQSYNKILMIGVGIASKAAAIIPYFHNSQDQFVLLTTTKTSISINPFNHKTNNSECLLSYEGKVMKISTFALGTLHDTVVNAMNVVFEKKPGFHQTVPYDPIIMVGLYTKRIMGGMELYSEDRLYATFDLFDSFEETYHHFMSKLVKAQVNHTKIVMTSIVRKIFVEGDFSCNHLFMHLLALGFPSCEVYKSNLENTSALGAAMVMNLLANTPHRIPVDSFTRISSSILPMFKPRQPFTK